jgi:hypothetical protein
VKSNQVSLPRNEFGWWHKKIMTFESKRVKVPVLINLNNIYLSLDSVDEI